MSTVKTYNKANDKCRVCFRVSKEILGNAKEVFLAADFTDWVPVPMKKLKNGTASLEKTLDVGCTYHYKYVLDGAEWVNDPEAEGYAPSGIDDVENSIVKL